MPIVTSLQPAAILYIVKLEEFGKCSFFGYKSRKLTFALQSSVWERKRSGDLFQKQYYNKGLWVVKCAVPAEFLRAFIFHFFEKLHDL